MSYSRNANTADECKPIFATNGDGYGYGYGDGDGDGDGYGYGW